MIPEESSAEVEAELRSVIEKAAHAVPEARVEVRRILLAEPLKPLPGSAVLSDALCSHASRVMGEPVTTNGTPLYTDARLYAARGVPIVLYGAGLTALKKQTRIGPTNVCPSPTCTGPPK